MTSRILKKFNSEFIFLNGIFIITSIITLMSFLINYFNLFTFFNLLIIQISLFVLFKNRKFEKKNKYFKDSMFTTMLICWSLLINGMDYSVFNFDWNGFGIPINLINDESLYFNDILANQEFPHYWIYKLVSIFVDGYAINVIFFSGFVLQNILIVKSFAIIYEKLVNEKSHNLSELIILAPIFFYPQISGHFTSLPFFLPSILGFSLAIYNLVNFIFVKERKIEDYLFIFLLIFVHPFWSIFITFYLFLIYIFSKDVGFDETRPLLGLLAISFFLNSFDGISVFQIYGSELVEFYKSYIKIHFNWSQHVGKIFKLSLNNYYQHSLLIVYLICLLLKRNIINFKTLENTFFTSFGIILLIIVLGNIFYYSNFNNFLIASNFYRIGSLAWFFIGIFIFRLYEGTYIGHILLVLAVLFYLISFNEVFNKQINLIPFFNFSSNFTYIFFIFGFVLLYTKKKNFSFFMILLGIIYYLLFYFIDKAIFDNYFASSLVLIIFVMLVSYYVLSKINLSYNFLVYFLLTLFLIATFDIDPLIKKSNITYQTQLSSAQINLIKRSTDSKSVILIEPSMSHFRKETQRGILIDYSLIPYSYENYKNYKYFKSLFNKNRLSELSVEEINHILNNTLVTDLLLPLGSSSEKYFKENYDFVNLGDLGHLILNVNN